MHFIKYRFYFNFLSLVYFIFLFYLGISIVLSDNNDEILIGIDAFIFIWSKIPKYIILSKLLKLPIIYQFSFIIYEILAFLLYIKNYKQFDK